MKPNDGMAEPGAPHTREATAAELYALHAPGAVRLAYFLTGDANTAQDLVQDAFVRIYLRFGTLKSPTSFHSYLNRTLINLSRKRLRRKNVEQRVLHRFRSPDSDPEADRSDPAARDELFQALKLLPHRQREALVLRFYADQSENQVAQAMACSPSAVNSLVNRGLRRLRETIAREEAF
jgi:RNA polymerase sigma-70 factor (sigma-E family)